MIHKTLLPRGVFFFGGSGFGLAKSLRPQVRARKGAEFLEIIATFFSKCFTLAVAVRLEVWNYYNVIMWHSSFQNPSSSHPKSFNTHTPSQVMAVARHVAHISIQRWHCQLHGSHEAGFQGIVLSTMTPGCSSPVVWRVRSSKSSHMSDLLTAVLAIVQSLPA